MAPDAETNDQRGSAAGARWPPGRARKFRQAAFVYLHVAILYEAAAFVMWQVDLLPSGRGHPLLWMLLGAFIAAGVVWALWKLQWAWLARVIWGLHALRLPAVIGGAFFPDPGTQIPASFYVTALVVILVNLWMLARAGWDL